MLPLGVVQGVTSINIGLNVIAELISGYALPGRPLAMMIFKTFGYITMAQYVSASRKFRGLLLNDTNLQLFPSPGVYNSFKT